MTAKLLILASATIVGLLGIAHLFITFWGPKLLPRDRSLKARMEEVHPMITRQTTIWRAWMGFNASHSMGAMLFGLVFGYLALYHETIFFGSVYLQVLGLVTLVGYTLLAKAYWFVTPLAGVTLSLVCYVAGCWIAWV